MSVNRPVEIQASQYYLHRSYVPSYYWICVFLEQWIAAAIFRNDTSRVFMASDGYAFRRRFELTDMSKDYDEIEASSLRFPFANYNPLNTGWEADRRPAANTAAMVYLGMYESGTKLKATAVTQNIPVTFYFDREDDARLAYDQLFFYTYNEHYYSLKVPYGTASTYPDGKSTSGTGYTLDLPVNINITGVKFNPTFTEKDWLNKNRIFIITTTFTCRTYAIHPPKQPDYTIDLSNNFNTDYDDGFESFYTVNDVILNMINSTYDVEVYDTLNNFPLTGKTSTIYVNSHLDEIPQGKVESSILPSREYYRWNDFSKKYEVYEPYKDSLSSLRVSGEAINNSIDVRKFFIKDKKSTSATIAWRVTNPEEVTSIELLLDGSAQVTSLSPEDTEYTFENLIPGSRYTAYINFFSKNGTAIKLQLSFTTTAGKSTSDKKNVIVGTTW